MSPDIRGSLTSSVLDVPWWALSFLRAHLAVIAALAGVPAVERVAGVVWPERPGPVAVTLDLVTLALRLVLLVVVARLAAREEPYLLEGGAGAAAHRLLRGAVRHWPALLVQLALFTVCFLLLNLLLDAVARLAGGAVAAGFDVAAVTTFAIRNTVFIPFAVVWLFGMARHLILLGR
ncbi:hypothetical protein ACFFMN_20415 [Planobispora siamensis]|nr:hypothetical protein [Planobispora siamensis]